MTKSKLYIYANTLKVQVSRQTAVMFCIVSWKKTGLQAPTVKQ